jgi:hypothetical protein
MVGSVKGAAKSVKKKAGDAAGDLKSKVNNDFMSKMKDMKMDQVRDIRGPATETGSGIDKMKMDQIRDIRGKEPGTGTGIDKMNMDAIRDIRGSGDAGPSSLQNIKDMKMDSIRDIRGAPPVEQKPDATKIGNLLNSLPMSVIQNIR